MGLREGSTLEADLENRGADRGAPRDDAGTPNAADEDKFLEQNDAGEGRGEDEDYEPGSDLSGTPITWDKREDLAKRTSDAQPEPNDGQDNDQAADAETDRQRQGKEETATVGRGELEEALRALRRDGWTQQMIDRFDDAELVAHSAKARQRQAAIQAKLDERARKLDPHHRGDDGQQRADAPDPAPDLDSLAEEAEEIFGDISGDSTLGRKAASVFRKLAEKALSAAQPAERATSADGAMLEALLNERARTRLAGVYPQLKSDNGLFEKVAQKAATLLEAGRLSGEYSDMRGLEAADSAWQDAARVLLGDPLSSKEREERRRARQHRDSGQVSAGRGKSNRAPGGFKNRDQAESAWLKAREAGDQQEADRIESILHRLPG